MSGIDEGHQLRDDIGDGRDFRAADVDVPVKSQCSSLSIRPRAEAGQQGRGRRREEPGPEETRRPSKGTVQGYDHPPGDHGDQHSEPERRVVLQRRQPDGRRQGDEEDSGDAGSRVAPCESPPMRPGHSRIWTFAAARSFKYSSRSKSSRRQYSRSGFSIRSTSAQASANRWAIETGMMQTPCLSA